jgi:hypothetical protein
MANNNKKAPAIVKRDSTINWSKATNYIPPVGTIIIMDNDDNSCLLKFGDGQTLVNDLPNLLDFVKPSVDEDKELLKL